uniref:Uncharacterized protein n=1 Tax=Cannabis sativa TaxID=3483 RepID=A0A803PWI2_CANSA
MHKVRVDVPDTLLEGRPKPLKKHSVLAKLVVTVAKHTTKPNHLPRRKVEVHSTTPSNEDGDKVLEEREEEASRVLPFRGYNEVGEPIFEFGDVLVLDEDYMKVDLPLTLGNEKVAKDPTPQREVPKMNKDKKNPKKQSQEPIGRPIRIKDHSEVAIHLTG